MYKVALHIGLPKTATTSLQSNLLYPAHIDGKVNYLGRYGEPFSDGYFNPFEHIYSKLSNENMSDNEISGLQKELSKYLKRNMLNIISEETLSLTHGVHYLRLENLMRVLSFCDVKVLISLRSPLDFFFSYYAELYRWSFCMEPAIDTIDKFAEELLRNPMKKDFDILFFERMLSKLSTLFPSLNVILFEDLKHDRECYIDVLSNFFVLNDVYIKACLLSKEKNIGIHSQHGKFSLSITALQKLQAFINTHFTNKTRSLLKKSRVFRDIYITVFKLLRNMPVSAPVEHTLLDEKKLDALCACLLIDLSVAKKFNLDENKLKLYGYIDGS